jgi:hypothetical protein
MLTLYAFQHPRFYFLGLGFSRLHFCLSLHDYFINYSNKVLRWFLFLRSPRST